VSAPARGGSSVDARFAPTLTAIARDEDELIATLISLSEINSGSFNLPGVEACVDALGSLFESLEADTTELIEVHPMPEVSDAGVVGTVPLGRVLRLRKHSSAAIQVGLVGHADTVFGIDHPFQTVKQTSDRLNGPGVADLKGGLVAAYRALLALEDSPWAGAVGWELLVNPDEEIGSTGSSPLLVEMAQRADFGLCYEPALADGGFATERKGSAKYSVVARGRAAHAGREHHLGRNAIRALAEITVAIDDLNGRRDGLTINPGFVHGGGAVNIVPETALMRIDARMHLPDDVEWLERNMQAIVARANENEGFAVELHGGISRPPKVLTPGIHQLIDHLQDSAGQLGFALEGAATGGCCDGNNLAAAGLPNIDNLGVRGGNIHSAQEFMEIESLVERSQLSALLLMRLAAGDLTWTSETAS
jgi:glutamate carboxypeptidase